MTKENQLSIFNNNTFGNIRTLTIDNTIYFVGKDIAEALGYSNTSKAVSTHCKNGEKVMLEAPSQNGNVVKTQTTIIPESDIYRLIIKSKLPQAQEFEKWVMEEVLPQIRKTGKYSVNPLENLDIADVVTKVIESIKPLVQECVNNSLPKAEITNKVEERYMDAAETIAHLRAFGMTKKDAEYHAYRIRTEFDNNPDAINYILREYFQRKLDLDRKKISVSVNSLIDDITGLGDWERKDTWTVFDDMLLMNTGLKMDEELEIIKKKNSKANRIDVLIEYKLGNKAIKMLKDIYKHNIEEQKHEQ